MIDHSSYSRLAHAEQALYEAIRQAAFIQTQIDQILKERAEYESALATKTKNFHSVQKQVRDTEKTLGELDTIFKKATSRTESASHQKELISALHEAEKSEQQKLIVEKQLFELWSELESLQSACTHLKKELEAFEQKNTALLTSLKQQLLHYQNEQSLHTFDYENVLQMLPENWRSEYKRMKAQLQLPIAFVTENLCNGCFYSLSPQDLVRLGKDPFLRCKNCFRFLCSK